jgi:hypothetical protein
VTVGVQALAGFGLGMEKCGKLKLELQPAHERSC